MHQTPGYEAGVSLSNSPTCAALIAQTLHDAGVNYVFGHPGGEVVELIDALGKCGVQFILTGHESAAAFMAGAVGRITGTPGVCLSTLGPGACNLVLGVGCAFLDRDPLLAFSARTSTDRSAISSKQNLDLNRLFVPISKWSVAMNGGKVADVLCSAISVARKPPRGPVYLTLPSDISANPEKNHEAALVPPRGAIGDTADLGKISRALSAAARPIGVVGIALDPKDDCAAVRRFFADTGIPYVTTPQAKGLADESGAGFLGTAGGGGGDQPIVDWLNQSDCLLGVGFDPVESSQDWHLQRPLYSIANSSICYEKFRPTAECVGKVGPFLDQLRSEYRGACVWRTDAIDELRRCTQRLICPHSRCGPKGLSPFHVIQTLRGCLPNETLVTADVGAHKMLLTQAWHAPEPGSFFISNGLSAMGYGVPAAITASLLEPNRPVVGIIGDGGFGMMVQELETAQRIRVKPLLVVFWDRSLAVIKLAQRARGFASDGVDFAPVDWAKVASGFGARGVTAGTFGAVEEAVTRWLVHPELTVLAVPIDEELYVGLTY